MMDSNTVCCMCGDIGFPDKLLRCSRCLHRFQHPYCSNYYQEDSSTLETAKICDWCRSEERSGAKLAVTKKQIKEPNTNSCHNGRSEYSSFEKIKQEEGVGSRVKASGVGASASSSSPRSAGGRRYKLLKDVLCSVRE